ncbi:hypothetical protein [Mesorhizobium sp. B2-3-15]|uniref:hypothetical protein n=1 Tax=Mesorhizobium sp. B2-3-15 TaxID=2589949 RepID=UPI00112673CF|nr:hypothetical protein [Mesorhizobium sp. B2-3-15]TPL64102.1 hypothetical protein FJ954_29780 [Mesorhizobium sp. B2-3-15]
MPSKADSVHIVMFGQADVSDVAGIFRDVFEVPATTMQPHPSGIGSSTSAPLGAISANLHSQPGRLEMVATPIPAQGATMQSIDVDEGLTFLTSKASKLIQSTEIVRLAVVVNLFESVSSAEAACKAFIKATGIDAPEDSTDLSFSLNYRKKMDTGGVVLNRLLRWEAALRQILQFSNVSAVPLTHNFHVLTLQVDVNSVPLDKPMEKSAAYALLDTLVKEAQECISGGYEYLIKNH